MISPYLDTSAIIYLVEGAVAAREAVARRIADAERAQEGRLLTSQLSRLECRVKPRRLGDDALLARYDALFTRARIEVVEISAAVIDRATELRARHGFKTPDALHLASAIEAGADGFVTGDAALLRCGDIRVAVVSPTAL